MAIPVLWQRTYTGKAPSMIPFLKRNQADTNGEKDTGHKHQKRYLDIVEGNAQEHSDPCSRPCRRQMDRLWRYCLRSFPHNRRPALPAQKFHHVQRKRQPLQPGQVKMRKAYNNSRWYLRTVNGNSVFQKRAKREDSSLFILVNAEIDL